jgi:hypothetical protein
MNNDIIYKIEEMVLTILGKAPTNEDGLSVLTGLTAATSMILNFIEIKKEVKIEMLTEIFESIKEGITE